MSEKIASITLDEGSIKKRSSEAEHEKTVAINDLLHENLFEPKCMKDGPYTIQLGVTDGRLVMDVSSVGGQTSKVVLPIAPLRSVIRDYFLICGSYYDAIKAGGCGKIEAIDMGRRGLHNEGAEELKALLEPRIQVDFDTARRLFTLICVLHIR